VDTQFEVSVADGAQDLRSLLSTFIPTETPGMTLTRMIARFHPTSGSVAGAWGKGHVDFGVAMVSQESFLAGVVPDPKTATEQPVEGWVYKDRLLVTQNGVGTPVLVSEAHVDLRAQRRIGRSELVLVADWTFDAGTTFVLSWTGIVRCLMLLP